MVNVNVYIEPELPEMRVPLIFLGTVAFSLHKSEVTTVHKTTDEGKGTYSRGLDVQQSPHMKANKRFLNMAREEDIQIESE
jgi:hypothetical protein